MRNRWQLWLLGSLLLGAAACGPSEEPIAITVGEEQITQAEFEEAFDTAVREDSTLGRDVAGLEKFAESLVRDRLRAKLIDEAVPELEAYRQERLIAFHESQMIERLHQQEYGDAYEVRESDLRRAYEKLGRRLKLHRIVVANTEEADEMRRALLGGAVFEKMAQQRSLDEETRGGGGVLGWLSLYDLDPIYAGRIFDLEVGAISGVIPAGEQSQIFFVADETENLGRGTFEQERDRLEQVLFQKQVLQAKKAYEQRIYEKYNLTFDPVEVAWMTAYMREKTRGAARGVEALPDDLEQGQVVETGDLPWEGFPVAAVDTSRVVATYDGPLGQVTPILVFDQLLTHPMPTWPEFRTTRDVENLIYELALEQIEVLECQARELDEDPEVIRAVEEREREIRERQFMRQEVRSKLQPTDEEIQAYYELHLDEYTEPERRRFVACNTRDLDRANRVAEQMRSGVSVDEIVREHAPADTSFQSTGSAGTPFMAEGESPQLDLHIFTLEPGEVTDPIQIAGGSYTVVKLVEIQPATAPTVEEMDTEIRRNIVDSRIPGFVDGLIADARNRYPVEIHWDVIRTADPSAGN